MGMIEVNGLKASSIRATLITSRSSSPAAGVPPTSIPSRGTHAAAVGVVAAAKGIPPLRRRKVKPDRRHSNSSSAPLGFIVRAEEVNRLVWGFVVVVRRA